MEKTEIKKIEDIDKILYKQVELLAENSNLKGCEPAELRSNTETILKVRMTLLNY